eukprot:c26900_g1_i1 orf=732-1688(+)
MESRALKFAVPSPIFGGIQDRGLGIRFHSEVIIILFPLKTIRTGLRYGQVELNQTFSKCKNFTKNWTDSGLPFTSSCRAQSVVTLLPLHGTVAKNCVRAHSTCKQRGCMRFICVDCPKRKDIHMQLNSFAMKEPASSAIYMNYTSAEGKKQRRGSSNHIQRTLNVPKQLRRHVVAITVAATADSDQTFPSQNEGGEKTIPGKPSPEIEPADVVQAQLKALREIDMATAFEFASPKNKAYTGPLSRFTEMIQGRAYNVMIGHESAEILSSLFISPCKFQQRVFIKGANDNQATFSWSLSKQEEGIFQGCWMTDSVHRDD